MRRVASKRNSRPWHSPYHVTQRNDPDIAVVKVYFPEEGSLVVSLFMSTPTTSRFLLVWRPKEEPWSLTAMASETIIRRDERI